MEALVEAQQKKIAAGNPKIKLLGTCRVGDGIALLNEDEQKKSIRFFDKRKGALKSSFFIPSSGSGSRMFGTLYDFMQTKNPSDETIEFVEHLINRIKDFALYNKLPQSTKEALESGAVDIEKFIRLLLSDEGFDFGNRPKGLVPFHRYGNFVINPFQEHILQGTQVGGDKTRFHFTINAAYEEDIRHSIKILREITGLAFYFEFSVQDEQSNAIAFKEDGTPFYGDDQKLVTRPAGHGALLHNLNNIDADLIFIRNIDNVQHNDHSESSIYARKWLAGQLLQFQETVFNILKAIDEGKAVQHELKALNQKYQLDISEDLFDDREAVRTFLNRPIRICGMVKNEGQPGGGPFWVSDKNGRRTRQIVEKSQISSASAQIGLLIKSTHFNPVEVICAPRNYKGEKFDLMDFRDESQYFIVNKTQKGKPVQFIELPGLWNGGMADWLTLFYEIDNDCFSPVKTVLDLLKPLHRPAE